MISWKFYVGFLCMIQSMLLYLSSWPLKMTSDFSEMKSSEDGFDFVQLRSVIQS